MSSRSFYSISLSFFVGVFLASRLSGLSSHVYAAALVLSLFSLASYIHRKDKRFLVVICSCLALVLGSLRAQMALPSSLSSVFEGEPVASIDGYICSEPEKKETILRFRFCPHEEKYKVLISAARYPEYRYGDVLSVTGRLRLPANFETYEGGPVFDYVSYLAKEGVRYTMFFPKIEKISASGGDFLLGLLFAAKSAFVEKMGAVFVEPESSLLSGLLLGERDSLPKDVVEDFKTSGLVHILVLSGYNVTIVAESLMRAFSFLPLFYARIAGGMSIVAFALMTGASATTVRASIMALIVVLSRFAGRRYDVARALIAAAVLMVLHNPMILALDISFQLSFVATLGLIFVSPLVSARLDFITDRWKVREIVAATIGTQIAVLPLLAWSMGQVSLVSLVSNILVLPVIPYAMLGGFIATSLGLASSILAVPFAWATGAALSYVIAIAQAAASVPFASIRIKASGLALAFMYALIVLWLIRAWRRRNSIQRSSS